MSAEGDSGRFVITCRIDGKDASGSPVYGLLACVVKAQDLLYAEALFSNKPIGVAESPPDAEQAEQAAAPSNPLPLSEILALTGAPRPEGRPEQAAKFEYELIEYIRNSRLFQNEKNLGDPKSLEHKVTYFCTSVLSLNAITFLEIIAINREDLYDLLPSLKKKDAADGGDSPEEGAASQEGNLSNMAVACDPVLDPVGGTAAGDLAVGMTVYCKMRKGSIFYNLLENASPDFDGTVSGDIIGVSINTLGSATVALNLSDGVTGAMKIAATVRVKTAVKAESEETGALAAGNPSVEVVFAIAGVLVFLSAVALLVHLIK